ncbi:MAG: hypothetical protein Q9209_003724 [Squamulea sp. 1 TL-2023]
MEVQNTSTVSGTIVFWLSGCVTIVVASQIGSYLERRLARIHARRNLMRRRAFERRHPASHDPDIGGHGDDPPPPGWPWPRPQALPTTCPADSPWPSSGLLTSTSGSPEWLSNSMGNGRMEGADPESNPVYAGRATEHRQAEAATPREGPDRKVESVERQRPVKRGRKARKVASAGSNDASTIDSIGDEWKDVALELAGIMRNAMKWIA